jgi:hypothetical protein
MATVLFLVKYTPLATNPSRALQELLIDHTDQNKFEGPVLQLHKDDFEFINQLQEHAKEHPEDAGVIQKIMQALDASENGIEMHIAYE